MGLDGRLVAKYAGSSKLLKRISLIISGMIFGDMLDVAKWLHMRRKCPGRDLLLTTVCRTGTGSRETLPLWWWPDGGVGPDGESAMERLVEGGECRPNNNETQKGRLTTQPAFKNTRCFRLDDTLLEHGLSHLHEAGDVGALYIVNMTVRLCTELNASLVDALHDVVQLIVNFLG